MPHLGEWWLLLLFLIKVSLFAKAKYVFSKAIIWEKPVTGQFGFFS
jgi:hypothetical protein